MNYTYANVGDLAIVDNVISSISPSTSIEDSNPNDIPTCNAVKEYVDSQCSKKPLAGKIYSVNSHLSTLLFDAVSALGATVNI